MGRRKSKLSTLHWFYNIIAFIFGIVPRSQLNHRISTKRYNRRINNTRSNKNIKTYTKRKYLQIDTNQNTNTKTNNEFNDVCKSSGASELTTILNNNNNNRNLENLVYNNMNANRSSDDNQQRILCIQVENNEAAESIQHLLMKHISIINDSQIIDLQDLIQFIRSTTNITHEDASTNTDHIYNQIISCTSFITQNENVCRLKALEYIRIYLEMNKEEFFNYLINEEHLCQQKTLAIYQMIKQFLKAIYQSEHEQKQNLR
ncbi:unnamed protein product [Rotaria sordida]|uniref:Uncharacterized protein n=1 Tax=Rotaria sordida TaxID=392033 RepID=A0A819UCE6_9BILA|nr:unnamed protein product [Rotaria sordida]CAF1129091.1 unnamed protein product [Rotaria sordida]CAF4071596.1 unnamed protein product [Rotaria sordida]CAF4094806.1 unnamed protein product [Rotaria sordida]